MSIRSVIERLDRLPSADREAPRRGSRALLAWGPRAWWAATVASVALGVTSWALGAGIVALWCFTVAAVTVAFALPLPHALVSPLYLGVLGWLVDMLPFVVLAGWAAVVVRWTVELARERRLPRGGRWMWLPVALAAWTALGVVMVSAADLKRFALLVAMQVLVSGTVLAVADRLADFATRVTVVRGVLAFVVALSAAVLMQWIGVDVASLQDLTVREKVESAYGVDAFANDTGMIKFVRSSKGGARELRRRLVRLRVENPEIPRFTVLPHRLRAYDTEVVVRFDGSARDAQEDLERLDIDLRYDNIGVAPANTVPRLRSFPRNALTYAGVCAALFPLAFFVANAHQPRRRWLGRVAAAACLFGAGFSLARSAWLAALVGVVYVVIDGVVPRRHKGAIVAVYLVGALVVTATFWIKYQVDPINARGAGQGSIRTRSVLYSDTIESLNGLHVLLGFGTERPRTESGTGRAFGTYGKYIPEAGSHSTYLNFLFRTGVPGAIGIVALYVIAALHARAAARVRSGAERRFDTFVAASVVAAGAHAVVLSLFVEPVYSLTIALLLGLAMAGAGALPTSVLPWRKRGAR